MKNKESEKPLEKEKIRKEKVELKEAVCYYCGKKLGGQWGFVCKECKKKAMK
jgi:tRNA(Ile2) C34 agmatinyltransferase TiaS